MALYIACALDFLRDIPILFHFTGDTSMKAELPIISCSQSTLLSPVMSFASQLGASSLSIEKHSNGLRTLKSGSKAGEILELIWE